MKYGLQLLVMYQYWFVNCQKCAPLMQNVNAGAGLGSKDEIT